MLQSDHDLLITLHEQVKGIRDDIKDLKDDTKAKVEDHELRVRNLEKRQWIMSGAAALLGIIAPYIWSLFRWIFLNLVKEP